MQDNADKENEKQVSLSWSEPTAATPAPKSQEKEVKAAPVAPKIDVPSTSTARLVGMVVVGIVVGVVVAWAWVALRASNGAVATNTGANATTSAQVGSGSSETLSVASPQLAGKSVAIEKAVVTSPTWIVVYENKDGKPGNALGAALFFPARQTGSVELLRATVAGKSYLIAKQVDNGDRKFSLKNDALVSENGAVQWVTLEVR